MNQRPDATLITRDLAVGHVLDMVASHVSREPLTTDERILTEVVTLLSEAMAVDVFLRESGEKKIDPIRVGIISTNVLKAFATMAVRNINSMAIGEGRISVTTLMDEENKKDKRVWFWGKR